MLPIDSDEASTPTSFHSFFSKQYSTETPHIL
jgi:hypothetical protein